MVLGARGYLIPPVREDQRPRYNRLPDHPGQGEAMIALAALVVLLAQAPAPVPASPKPVPTGPVVALETTLGTIKIALYAKESPLSTENFLVYVRAGFYSGTIFHRVMRGFMVQGGGLTTGMQDKPALA